MALQLIILVKNSSLRKWVLLFILFFLYSIVAASSQSIIKTLPGFNGTLPLNLETGGGPGCSGFSGLVYETGPLKFDFESYFGGLPSLTLNPYSWTQIANMIFLDAPVGTGFSYSTTSEGYYKSDTKYAKDTSDFIKEWLLDHPRFFKNPLYVAGDSYAGKLVPLVVLEVAKGNEACDMPYPSLWLQGYILGNPLVNPRMMINSKFTFAHRMGLVSDEYYECISRIDPEHILEVNCGADAPESDQIRSDYRFSEDTLVPSWHNKPWCRKYSYLLSYAWANNPQVREALHVRYGTTSKWKRCDRKISYLKDIPDVLEYHYVLSKNEYRVLVYSGDHDMAVPYIGTIEWIRYLNLTLDVNWRPWFVDDEVAGYTEKYKQNGYNITFATVKGGGHTAPMYRPRECLAMIDRWLSDVPM